MKAILRYDSGSGSGFASERLAQYAQVEPQGPISYGNILASLDNFLADLNSSVVVASRVNAKWMSVVMGDFNMPPGSLEYQALVGAPDYHTGSVAAHDLLVDAWTAGGHGLDDGPTWVDERVEKRLDYVFLSPGLVSRLRRCWVDSKALGSDHQPVWIEIDA